MNAMKTVLALLAVVAAVGCAKPIYLNREGSVVAVLPPQDNTNANLEAWEKAWPVFEREVAVRGYAVVSQAAVREFMASRKYTIPAELNQHTCEELAQAFKADFVFYPQMDVWDRTTVIIYTKLKVGVSATLKDKAGVPLWQGEGEETDTSAGITPRQMIAQTVGGLFASMEHMLPPAVSDCCRSLPHCGFDPSAKPAPEKK